MAEDQNSLPRRSPRRDPYRLAGETFDGRYRLEEFAGMGSFGAVYRATATRVGRTVAVKILKPDLGEDETAGARELFQREALTAGRLLHRHVVAVIDVGEHEGFAYMVMEWLDGRTLEQEMRGRSPLSPEETAMLLAQITDALQYAHDSGVIHRDIKPSNIHLGLKDRPFVKMLDFGIAKVISSSTAVAASRIAGTVSYMSPEQITGSAINHRSDIYSLGIVLYQMLTGALPFVGESQGHIIQQHIAAPPPRLNNVRPDLPYALTGVIERALAKNPEDRQSSATALCEDFSAAIRATNQPTEVYRPPKESGSSQHSSLQPTQVVPEPRDYIPFRPPQPQQDQGYYPTAPAGGGTAQNPYAPQNPYTPSQPYRNEVPPTQVAPPPEWMRPQPPAYQPPPYGQSQPVAAPRKSRNLLTFVIASASALLFLFLIKAWGTHGDLLYPIPAVLTSLFMGAVVMWIRILIRKASASSPAAPPLNYGSQATPLYQQVPQSPVYAPVYLAPRGAVPPLTFAVCFLLQALLWVKFAPGVILFFHLIIIPLLVTGLNYLFCGRRQAQPQGVYAQYGSVKQSRGVKYILLFALTGALSSYLLHTLFFGLYLHQNPNFWPLYSTMLIAAFVAMLCLVVSTFYDFGVWAAHPGRRGRALLTYGAGGATAAMISFSIMPFSTYGFSRPLIIFLPLGFVVGLIVCGIRIAVQKPQGQRQW